MNKRIILPIFLLLALASFVSAQTYSVGETVTLNEGSTIYVNIHGIDHSFILDPFLGNEVGIIIDGTYSSNPIMLKEGDKYTLQQNPVTYLEVIDIFQDRPNDIGVKLSGVTFIIKVLDCEDSDNGDDIYIRGYRINLNLNAFNFGQKQYDYCIKNPVKSGEDVIAYRGKEVDSCSGNDCYVIEYHCKEDLADEQKGFFCPGGCENGRCIKGGTCKDSDSGLSCGVETEEACKNRIKQSVFIKGEVKGFIFADKDEIGTKEDKCAEKWFHENGEYGGWRYIEECSGENCGIAEAHCYIPESGRAQASDIFIECKEGCSNGACKTTGDVKVTPTEESGPITIPTMPTETSKSEYICNGCLMDNKCYPFGYRKASQFCSDTGSFAKQLEGDKVCENNFECSSNVCVSGTCISEGLLQKILNWFKNLFSFS